MKRLTEQDVLDALRMVYDAELPVNIVDLGLVYGVAIADGVVAVRMTLTTSGCSMGAMMATDARARLLSLPGVQDARVDLVLDPPWHPGLMSEGARTVLGIH